MTTSTEAEITPLLLLRTAAPVVQPLVRGNLHVQDRPRLLLVLTDRLHAAERAVVVAVLVPGVILFLQREEQEETRRRKEGDGSVRVSQILFVVVAAQRMQCNER